jgi:hypothetical protein
MKHPFQSFTKFVKQRRNTILLMLVVILATLLVSALVSIGLYKYDKLQLPTIGTIKTQGVKAYWDPNLTHLTTEIPWPTVHPGTLNNATLYLQSVSSITTVLELDTTNWTFISSNGTIVSGPSNSTQFMSLTWNYNNTTVEPSQTVQVILTLKIDDSDSFIWYLVNNKVAQFSFDITIRTNEPP